MAKEIKDTEYYVVISCDGGTKPNPGPSGSGIHGYMYSKEDINKSALDKPNNYVVTNKGLIHTDYLTLYPNIKTVKPTLWIDGAVIIKDVSTNNIAEVLGITNSLDICIKLKEKYNIVNILIRADSEYAIRFIQKIMSNAIEEIVSNVNLIPHSKKIVDKIKELNISIDLEKVEGHSGDHGNDIADNIATLARLKAEQENLSPKSDVKTPEYELRYEISKTRWGKISDFDIAHPFIKYKQVFFNNHDLNRNPTGIVGVMDYKNDEDVGVKSNTATYGIVKLNKTSDLIKDAINSFYNSFINTSMLSILHIDKLLENHYLILYKLFGKLIFSSYNKTTLFTIDNEPIAYNLNPPGLATIALDKLATIENISISLQDYRNKTNSKIPFTFINITDSIYNINKKGKYECIIPNAENYLPVSIDYEKKKLDILINLKSDTISRNKLKQLGDNSDKVEVYLILDKQDENTIIYYIGIVSTKNDIEDIGIFTNYYSCKILLNKK